MDKTRVYKAVVAGRETLVTVPESDHLMDDVAEFLRHIINGNRFSNPYDQEAARILLRHIEA